MVSKFQSVSPRCYFRKSLAQSSVQDDLGEVVFLFGVHSSQEMYLLSTQEKTHTPKHCRGIHFQRYYITFGLICPSSEVFLQNVILSLSSEAQQNRYLAFRGGLISAKRAIKLHKRPPGEVIEP